MFHDRLIAFGGALIDTAVVRVHVGTLALCVALAGCLPMAVPARLDVQRRAARTPTCDSKGECYTAWNEAIEWVSQRCAFPIKSESQFLVETDGPGRWPSTSIACRLQRNLAIAPGTEEIQLTPTCGNWVDCTPELVYFQAAFNDQIWDALREMRSGTASAHE